MIYLKVGTGQDQAGQDIASPRPLARLGNCDARQGWPALYNPAYLRTAAFRPELTAVCEEMWVVVLIRFCAV